MEKIKSKIFTNSFFTALAILTFVYLHFTNKFLDTYLLIFWITSMLFSLQKSISDNFTKKQRNEEDYLFPNEERAQWHLSSCICSVILAIMILTMSFKIPELEDMRWLSIIGALFFFAVTIGYAVIDYKKYKELTHK